jgi:hypothetical protein
MSGIVLAMKHGVLIDDDGEYWPDDSLTLAQRLGYPGFGDALVFNAIRERGFVHVRQDDGGAYVTLRVGRFSLACLAGTMQLLGQVQAARVVACILSDSGSTYEMFPSIFDFVERTEALTKEGRIGIKLSRIAIPRDSRNVNLPTFSLAHPLLKIWRQERGELSRELMLRMVSGALLRRIILMRRPARSSKILVEHFGAAITIMRPCEALSLSGRLMEDMYDREYGSWIVPAYAETLGTDQLRLESMLADIRVTDGTTIRARYDRLLLPWHSRRGDSFVLCASLLRDRSVLPAANETDDLAHHRVGSHPE